MKVSIKGYITCKSSEQYVDCADNYAVNISSNRFSVSDGVSKSFFPKVWSEILVNQFVNITNLKESELIKVCQVEWQKRIDEIVSLPETKWFTKAQYNRKDPALATFVALQFFIKEKKWSASALGDSFLFFVPKGYKDYQNELVKLSSKIEPLVFDNFPDYLTSIGELHKGITKKHAGTLKDGSFYLMTDALAEWFINEGENAIGKIIVWKSQSDFESFITLAINANELTNDDCAILCIEISESDRKGIEYKKIQVTDLNVLINGQEATNEKAKQNKQKEVELKQELKASIQNSEELESPQRELLTSVSLIKKSKYEIAKEGLRSKVRGIFLGKEKEKTKETLPKQIVATEIEVSVEQNSEQLTKTDEELNKPEKDTADDSISDNDKPEELEKETVEEEVKNDNFKTEADKLVQQEQLKVDSKAKNIFDKF